MLKFYAKSEPGLEEELIKELTDFGIRAYYVRPSMVSFETDEEAVPLLNMFSRTATRFVILLGDFRVNSLDEIGNAVREIDFRQWIDPAQSFAVRALRIGVHEFTSMDIAARVGEEVIRQFGRLRVNLDEPDVVVKAELYDDWLVIGIDTTGSSLHKRWYRVYKHPAPLRPTIASAMLYHADWRGGPLLDPFCGSGTILIEAFLKHHSLPPNIKREFAYQKIKHYHNMRPLPTRFPNALEGSHSIQSPTLVGIERFEKHVRGACENVGELGVYGIEPSIRLLKGIAQKLDELVDDIQIVITNPPFGLRIGKKGKMFHLYRGFVDALVRKDVPKVCLLTKSLLPQAMLEENYKVRSKWIMYGNLPVRLVFAHS
jgi:tRNA (guanine6-N2)-methyltransferase